MSSLKAQSCVVVYLALFSACRGNYRSDGGFLPSATYQQRTEDQLAQPAARVDRASDNELGSDSKTDRRQRFGISTYGDTAPGVPYGGSATGLYGPLKIDLGGVLLGSIIGFGAVLVLPKLIHALSYTYGGGYGRSADLAMSETSDILSKIDETLTRYNIDSSTCFQRIACSYVQAAKENVNAGKNTDVDALIASLSGNALVQRMLEGSSILDALSAGGSQNTNCHEKYSKCELDKKTVLKMISQMLP